MKKQTILRVNLLLTLILAVGTVAYQLVGGRVVHYSTSAVFVLMGAVNLLFAVRAKAQNLRFYIAMALGLALCMLGDILLKVEFALGAAAFASGHIAYFIAYSFLQRPCRTDFLIGGALFLAAGAFLMFCPLLTFWADYLRWVCLAYTLIISLMTGKALSGYFAARTDARLLLAIGSAMFFFSDLMLALNWFMETGSLTGKLCMIAYFPAQGFLSWGMVRLMSADASAQIV